MKTSKLPVTGVCADHAMKKSTKTLVGGIFVLTVIFAGEAMFSYLGLDFGTTQFFGCSVAGCAGALKLIS